MATRLSTIAAAVAGILLAGGCGEQPADPSLDTSVGAPKVYVQQRRRDLTRRRHDRQQQQVIDQVRGELMMLRAACELYRAQEGDRYPDFESMGWQQLVDGSYIIETPRNVLSPDEAASKVLVVDKPGLTGADVDPAAAGWVWNRSSRFDGMLFATGCED